MAVLREAEGSVARPRLDQAWSDAVQRERALQSLIADGLVVESDDRYALPSLKAPDVIRGGRRSDHLV